MYLVPPFSNIYVYCQRICVCFPFYYAYVNCVARIRFIPLTLFSNGCFSDCPKPLVFYFSSVRSFFFFFALRVNNFMGNPLHNRILNHMQITELAKLALLEYDRCSSNRLSDSTYFSDFFFHFECTE